MQEGDRGESDRGGGAMRQERREARVRGGKMKGIKGV